MINKIVAFLFIVFLSTAIGVNKIIFAVDCSDSTYAKVNESICRNELKDIEAQEKELLRQVNSLDKQSKNYASELKKLNLQIESLKAKIKARSLVIAQLKVSIDEKVSRIQTFSEKIDREYESLAQLLRNTNEFDNENIIYLALSNKSISDFYGDLESYTSIKKSIKDSVEQIVGVKIETEIQKKELESKKNAETDAKAELENAQNKVSKTETKKKQLLAISEKDKAAFQKLATEKKIRADKIRTALFELRDSKAIPFGTALQYAKSAEKFIGISPAFLLAIITQESNLGTDTGSCYLTNFETGGGISSKSGKFFQNVMKPMGLPGRKGDVDDFISITKSVGRDPTKTLISFPI